MGRPSYKEKKYRKRYSQHGRELVGHVIDKEQRDIQYGKNPVNGLKRKVQEIFLREGIEGVINYIERNKDENGNYLVTGKIVHEWLKELDPLPKKENVQEEVQEGDER